MRTYIQLNEQNIAVSEVRNEGMPTSETIIDVTGRVDGPWLGKQYDTGTDTFMVIVVPPQPLSPDELDRRDALNLVSRHQNSLTDLERARMQQLILKGMLKGGSL